MPLRTWDEFAVDLTAYVRKHWSSMHRGAMLMPFIHDTTLFALVFGNNSLLSWDSTNAEVELIRQHVRGHGAEDLGFGLSLDGLTWALLVRLENEAAQTRLGRDFQCEMLKLTLEEAVREIWWTVHDRASAEQGVLQNEGVH